jgi:hypothetical protein
MSAAPHCSSSCINKETHQETDDKSYKLCINQMLVACSNFKKQFRLCHTSSEATIRADRKTQLMLAVFYISRSQSEWMYGWNLCSGSDLNELALRSVMIMPHWCSWARLFIPITHKYLQKCKKLFLRCSGSSVVYKGLYCTVHFTWNTLEVPTQPIILSFIAG